MFKTAERTELSQVSLTGMRALVLMGLLIVKPRSLEEIREEFINLQIMEDSHSDDILRIDLNTIKIMGCEISRACKKTDFKYVLTKHPFSLKIAEEEIEILKKVYNLATQKADLCLILKYDELLRKIAFHICEEESKEALLGVSALRYYDIKMIKDLMVDCKHKTTLDLMYKKPTNLNDVRKLVVAQELVYKNNKIYLYGYDLDKQESIVLNLRRVTSIRARKLEKQNIESNQLKIRFVVKNLLPEELEINEEIVDSSVDGYVVEGAYHNEFIATQRVLSFGPRCIILEPVVFKNEVINKIKEMRKNYEC